MLKINRKTWKAINKSMKEIVKRGNYYTKEQREEFYTLSAPIREEIEIVEKRCTARTTTTFNLLYSFWDCRLNQFGYMTDDDFDGTTITVNPNHCKLPNAYKYNLSANSTQATATYKKGIGFIISDIFRDNTEKDEITVRLTNKGLKAKLRNAGFIVRDGILRVYNGKFLSEPVNMEEME